MATEIFCVKCGHKFIPVGREHICPACKQDAAAAAKKAAVMRAKRASWTGESVPVRISGRASTVIRTYGRAFDLPFAAALDALIQTTQFFVDLDTAWDTIQPYKSHRRDKSTAEDVPHAATVTPVAPATPVKASKASKASKTVKVASASKATKTNKK